MVSITQRGDQNCSPRLVTRVQVRPADVMWSYLPLALSHSKKLLLIGTIIIRRRLKTSKMSPPELNDPSIKVPNFAGVTVSKFNFKLYSIMIFLKCKSIESMSKWETSTEDAAADTMGQWRKSRAAPARGTKTGLAAH